MAFNRKQRLRDNIEAIRTAFVLDREQRTPTARERLLLERYCGFGGLKCILNPAKELTDAVHWAKSDLELFAPTVELHKLLRENTKDDTEYKRYMDAMKQSVLTAFYTPPEITGAIADVLHEHGIRPDRVLEPSAGVGAFVDAVLENKPDADIMAFEPCPFIRSCGTVGAFTDEGFVGRLFKFVCAEIIQQIQTVVGKVGLSLVFLLVVHYFGI